MRQAGKRDFVPRFVPRFALRYPHQPGKNAIGMSWVLRSNVARPELVLVVKSCESLPKSCCSTWTTTTCCSTWTTNCSTRCTTSVTTVKDCQGRTGKASKGPWIDFLS